MRQLCKGNVAVIKGALLAGCQAYYGYPITPASEIAESAAAMLPQVGAEFLQAESEVSAINMVYGAASAGLRVMTASSGPGVSLMQEGISYLAGAELPCVIVDVMRGGPGLGNIAPEQGDYFALVKGGGHGCYRNLVLAPNSAQEMCDLTRLAFDLAERYRNPVVVLSDGFIGQMMEPLELDETAIPDIVDHPFPSWAVRATPETRGNLVTSIQLLPDVLEAHIRKLERKYQEAEEKEIRFEYYDPEGGDLGEADVLLVGYGIVSRVLRSTAEQANRKGIRAALFRPISLYPFPSEALARAAASARMVQVVEMSTGQMVEDVRLALEGAVPVEFFGRVGGNVPRAEEVLGELWKHSNLLHAEPRRAICRVRA